MKITSTTRARTPATTLMIVLVSISTPLSYGMMLDALSGLSGILATPDAKAARYLIHKTEVQPAKRPRFLGVAGIET